MELTRQTLIFLEACLLGFLLGGAYDLFRILRLAVPHGKVLVFVEDVLYFCFLTLASFIFVMTENSGLLRGFLLFGELLGAVLYFFTLSFVLMKAAKGIIKAVYGLFRLLYKLLLFPAWRFCRWIGKKLKGFLRKWRIYCKKLAVNLQKLLPYRLKLVYNKTNQIIRRERFGKKKCKQK